MKTLLIALIGAVANRLRGGGLVDFADHHNIISENDLFKVKRFAKIILHDLVFALIFTYGLFKANGYLHYGIRITILYLYLSMLLGRSMGWGSYIAGIIDDEEKPKEIGFIDRFIKRIDASWHDRYVVALGLRGFIWTLSITSTICFLVKDYTLLSVSLIGLLMGLCYSLGCEIAERVHLKRSAGWPCGEVIWGFVMWGSLAYFLL